MKFFISNGPFNLEGTWMPEDSTASEIFVAGNPVLNLINRMKDKVLTLNRDALNPQSNGKVSIRFVKPQSFDESNFDVLLEWLANMSTQDFLFECMKTSDCSNLSQVVCDYCYCLMTQER